jgi:hypothetical protein
MTRWTELDRFLATDPRDVGCERAMAILHVYVEAVAADEDVARRFPGVLAHLASCGPCTGDFEGLLAAVREDTR